MDWLAEMWDFLFGTEDPPRRRVLHRAFTISGSVRRWVREPDRQEDELLAFAELILKLDADPVSCSEALFGPDIPAGLRWAPFHSYKALFVLDLGRNSIKVLTCVPAHGGA